MTSTAQHAEPRLPLLRNRNFRLLWIGQALSDFGSSMTFLVLPLALLAAGYSTSVAGTIGTAILLTGWLVQVPAGYLADRFDQRRLMLGADLGRLVLAGAMTMAVFSGQLPIALMLFCVVVAQAGQNVFRPAQNRVIRRVVPTAQLATAVSLNQARTYGADIAAPAAAGLLFALHPGVPFAVDTLTFAVSALCVLALTKTRAGDPNGPRHKSFLSEVTAGCRHLIRDRFLRWSAAYFSFLNLSFAVLTYAIILGIGTRPGGAVLVGAAMSSAAVAGLAGSLVAPWAKRRLSLGVVLSAGPAVAGVLLAIAWANGAVIALVASFSALCLLTPVTGAMFMTIITQTVPEQILGRVGAAVGSVTELLQPFGPLVAGVLLANLSLGLVASVLATTFGLLAVVGLVLPAPARPTQ